MTLAQLPPRGEVPQEQTWNLESIFPDSKSWEAAYKKMEGRLSEFEEYKGKLSQTPQTLLACLKLRDDVLRGAQKVAVYSGLDSSTDVSDQKAQARAGQGHSLMNRAHFLS